LAHPDTALGAPVSDPAGIEFRQKRAGSEIGAPHCQQGRGQCQLRPWPNCGRLQMVAVCKDLQRPKTLLKNFSGLRFRPISMAKGNTQKQSNGSALNSESTFCSAADSFRADLHPDLKAKFVPVRKGLVTATRASANPTLAKPNRRSVGETELHPPFNLSDWGGENLRQELCL